MRNFIQTKGSKLHIHILVDEILHRLCVYNVMEFKIMSDRCLNTHLGII